MPQNNDSRNIILLYIREGQLKKVLRSGIRLDLDRQVIRARRTFMESAMQPLVSRRWNLRIASVVRKMIYFGSLQSQDFCCLG